MRIRWQEIMRIGVPIVTLAVATRVAFAGFVVGVEHFDGTVKDTVNWEQYDGGKVISQNEALTIADPEANRANMGDYTTRQVALLPGSSVSAKVRESAPGIATLFLTNNSNGTRNATVFDSYWAELEISVSEDQTRGAIWRWIGAGGSSSQGGELALVSNPIGQTFKFEIVRPNSTDYIFRAYDAQDTLLGSNTFLGSTPHPEALFISIYGINGSTATWDDVTVSGNIIPEPASMSLVAMACSLSLWLTRQHGRKGVAKR